ncbi:hypothetical protein [Hyalangium minutum]|uniref:Uncharacterized protein n=1 Tax=Hyalangium minutum TaxID=394096 RepID=A0A085W6J2_9BACT|nr:hypothetical protein [Hyalangium minutum]KFE63305.1 hypothetical protein DB31_2898 [Hyalangium minutum]
MLPLLVLFVAAQVPAVPGQDWHRKVDQEIIEWLRRYDRATPEQFMKKLREIYGREDMVRRFPNGF